jgi:hypothetical protein
MPAVVVLTVILAPLLIAATTAQIQKVFVTNFPDLQRVTGIVRVDAPIPASSLRSIADVLVSPVAPEDTNHLVPGGTIDADGFTEVVLSLVGQTKGDLVRSGRVGAFLIPDEEPVQKVLEERGLLQFPLQVESSFVSRETPYFSSNQPRMTLAFPRYRVYFYNSTDRSVTVSLYAYLTG